MQASNRAAHRKIGQWLQEKREATGQTRSQLPKTLGRHRSYVAKYEAGKRVEIVQFVMIAEVLKADPRGHPDHLGRTLIPYAKSLPTGSDRQEAVAIMGTAVTDNDVGLREEIGNDSALDSQWQVILWNDEVNEMGHVVHALMRVFGHNRQIAEKIMMDAHKNGKTIAQVEDRDKAQRHKDILQNDWGLTVEIEKI